MPRLSFSLPESLYDQACELAARKNISMEELISLAVREKLSALETEGYLAERAARGDRAAFEAALLKVPGVPPDAEDAL